MLMKQMTGMDLDKVYRRRTIGNERLARPKVKFFSTEQLKQVCGSCLFHRFSRFHQFEVIKSIL